MAFKDGIFNMFGLGANNSAQQPVSQPQQTAAPQQMQAPVQQLPNGNGSGGPAQHQPQAANNQLANPTNPLDGFAKLLTPSQDVLKASQSASTTQNYLPEIPADQLQKLVNDANFTAKLNPEQVQKALSGDQTAFMQVLNGAMQEAFMANLQLSRTFAEQAAKSGADQINGSMDSRFRELQIKNHTSENPALQHPVGQAMLNSLKSQIAKANPQMRADQVHAEAEKGFQELAKLMNTNPQTQQASNDAAAPKNWLKYLE